MLVFVPLSRGGLRAWATSGAAGESEGFAATPDFLAAFGLASPDEEETDLTLATVASVAGLLRHGVRLVAVVEGRDAEPLAPADFGAVRLAAPAWGSVTALFADAPEAEDAAATLRAELGERPLGEAWDAEATEAFRETHDLLWHGSAEWERLSD